MLNQSLNELKLAAKSTGIKRYKNMSKERLLGPLSESELVKSKKKDQRRFNKLRDFESLK